GTQTRSRQAIRRRRLEDRAGLDRLPRPGGPSILLGAAQARRGEARRTTDGDDRGSLPARRARGLSRTQLSARDAHDCGRAHASGAPRAPRVEPVAAGALGTDRGAEDCRAGGGDPLRPPAPRAGLSVLPGNTSPGATLRSRAARGSVRASAWRRRALLPPPRLDPQARSRPSAVSGAVGGR